MVASLRFPLLLLLAITPTMAAPPETRATLESLRAQHDLPALAVAVVKGNRIVDLAAVGVRKIGDSTPVTDDDLFHIGSCTKSMTATLAALMVEKGELRWDTTLQEVFPKLPMHPDYRAVTLEQLLQNRGGVPGAPPEAAWTRAWEAKGSILKQRRDFIKAVLADPPEVPPGTLTRYSNQGFTLAGAMLEETAHQPWEALITQRLFRPLGMNSAGFGTPGHLGKLDAPWGHRREQGKLVPIQEDNPPAISPAGRVHLSLSDLARYAMLHLGSDSPHALLKKTTLEKLHTPPEGTSYACGWVVVDRPWAGGHALTHNGSNTMWYAVMWLAPEKHFAVVTATNVAGPEAEAACDEATSSMIQKWLQP
ncbi:CubicO group peptidase (beta-lactamase class C family) [Haloferula luteola]|uniref:CubicO group peptidase (Beta-lactamase class C family) n=1 Tax=Haloferula luteola TaxID=595692 RepID=A0A840V5M1_9BACT|nr:serine hydrolase domain-containing protein [Haloferula luteola]MBB5350924.1 CubicO group peptidase (beta-lactamase class C family) [Haloferula luteola]